MKFSGITEYNHTVEGESLERNSFGAFFITSHKKQGKNAESKNTNIIKPETLKVYLYDKWHLVSELDTPKRKPDPNGVLPMTPEELEELKTMVWGSKHPYTRLTLRTVMCDEGFISINMFNNEEDYGWSTVKQFKAILYLDKLFDLNGEK